jgi:hypothetical protein
VAFSLIVSASGTGTSGSCNTTGANLIVLVGVYDGGGTGAFTDSKGNTYTLLTRPATTIETAASNSYVRLAYCYAPTVGSGHTFTISPSYGSIHAIAVSGSASSPFDVESAGYGSNAANATTNQPETATPSVDNCLLVAGLGVGDTGNPSSIDSSFTFSTGIAAHTSVRWGGALAYQIQTTATARNPTWTWTNSSSNGAVMAAFKAAAAGGGGGPIFGSGILVNGPLYSGRLAA